MLKAIARKVLPVGMQRVLRQPFTGSLQLSISYELLQEWPRTQLSSWKSPAATWRFKKGLETLSTGVTEQEVEAAFLNPIVRDNLEALSKIDLQEASLLDFGCRNGLYRVILATYPKTARWKYIGADINPEVVEFCRSLHRAHCSQQHG